MNWRKTGKAPLTGRRTCAVHTDDKPPCDGIVALEECDGQVWAVGPVFWLRREWKEEGPARQRVFTEFYTSIIIDENPVFLAPLLGRKSSVIEQLQENERAANAQAPVVDDPPSPQVEGLEREMTPGRALAEARPEQGCYLVLHPGPEGWFVAFRSMHDYLVTIWAAKNKVQAETPEQGARRYQWAGGKWEEVPLMPGGQEQPLAEGQKKGHKGRRKKTDE